MRNANHGLGRTIVGAAFALAVAASTATGRADAQVHIGERGDNHWIWRHSDGDSRFEISLRGRISITEDERAIASLSPRGRLQIEDVRPGAPDRLLIVSSDEGGALSYAYLVNGRAESWSPAGEAWLAEVLPRMAREAGIGAEERVRRIHARSGAGGVLSMIDEIGSSSSRGRHLDALLAIGPLPRAEASRAIAVIRRITSSSTRSRALQALWAHLDVGDASARTAYFQAVADMTSSSQRRAVLMHVLESGRATPAVHVPMLDATAAITSNSERAAILVALADRRPFGDANVRSRFFDVVDGLTSNSERRRILTHVLSTTGSDREVARAAIRSARRLSSDSEKSAVLMAIPGEHFRDSATTRLYREAMDSINSRSARQRVERRLEGVEG